MERYKFLTDDSAHWYLVASNRAKLFFELLEACDIDRFELEFSADRLNCHPSFYSFVNPTNDMKPPNEARKGK